MLKVLIECGLPILILGGYIYSKDKSKEPLTLLFKLLLYGVLSAIVTVIIKLILSAFIPFISLEYSQMTVIELVINTFIFIALLEEGCKYFFLYRNAFDHEEFDTTFDMAVYACFVSLGFAFFENIIYYFQYGEATQILRYFTAVPLHLCTGIFMGIYLGDAALASRKNIHESKVNKVFALIVPMFIHGFYDFTLLAGYSSIWVVSFVIIVITSVIIVNFKRKHDMQLKYPDNRCPNCKEKIYGVYCIKCGKKLF